VSTPASAMLGTTVIVANPLGTLTASFLSALRSFPRLLPPCAVRVRPGPKVNPFEGGRAVRVRGQAYSGAIPQPGRRASPRTSRSGGADHLPGLLKQSAR
jgi:hypothetical protein